MHELLIQTHIGSWHTAAFVAVAQAGELLLSRHAGAQLHPVTVGHFAASKDPQLMDPLQVVSLHPGSHTESRAQGNPGDRRACSREHSGRAISRRLKNRHSGRCCCLAVTTVVTPSHVTAQSSGGALVGINASTVATSFPVASL